MNRRQFLHGSLARGADRASRRQRRAGADAAPPRGDAAPRPHRRTPAAASAARASSSSTPTPDRSSGCAPPMRWRRPPSRWCAAACACTVQPHPAHIDPAQVAQELPAFVNRLRSHGLRVDADQGTGNRDLTDAKAEAIIGAAAQAGITHYSLGGYTLRLEETARAPARRDQAAPREVRAPERAAQDQARVRHGDRRRRGRRRRARSAAGHEGVRSTVHRLPLGHRPHGAAWRRHVGDADAPRGSVRRVDRLARSRMGAGSRAPR